MFYLSFFLYQCLIPFVIAFGTIALAFVVSRPPMHLFPIKIAVPAAVGLIVLILLWGAIEAIQVGRPALLTSKAFGLAGLALALHFRAGFSWTRIQKKASTLPRSGVCRSCQYHQRTIWGPLPAFPKTLYRLDRRHGLSFLECQHCGGNWVHYAYSPEKRFPYLAKWEFGWNAWMNMRKVDRGVPILNWHSIEIKRGFTRLSGEEALQVELHRKCTSFQNNPVDALVPPPTFVQMPD